MMLTVLFTIANGTVCFHLVVQTKGVITPIMVKLPTTPVASVGVEKPKILSIVRVIRTTGMILMVPIMIVIGTPSVIVVNDTVIGTND